MLRSIRQQPYTRPDSDRPTKTSSLRDSRGKKIVFEQGPASGVVSSLRVSPEKTRGYNHPSATPHTADKDKNPKGQMSKEKERRVIKEMIEKELFETASSAEEESEDEDDAPPKPVS